jgi:hypothetical protein
LSPNIAQLRSFGPNVANISEHVPLEPKVSVARGALLDDRVSISGRDICDARTATA